MVLRANMISWMPRKIGLLKIKSNYPKYPSELILRKGFESNLRLSDAEYKKIHQTSLSEFNPEQRKLKRMFLEYFQVELNAADFDSNNGMPKLIVKLLLEQVIILKYGSSCF